MIWQLVSLEPFRLWKPRTWLRRWRRVVVDRLVELRDPEPREAVETRVLPRKIDVRIGDVEISGRAVNGWTVCVNGKEIPSVRRLVLKLEMDQRPELTITHVIRSKVTCS